MSTKIIVTNQQSLHKKYGPTNWPKIDAALRKLIRSDGARALTTSLVRLDDHGDMAPYGAPVLNPRDEKQNKQAIDSVASAKNPDYIMLLGASDVVPFQQLQNPTPADGDSSVPSDLPYACAHSYSTSISDFIAPSRVVGRLPDLIGGTNYSYLVDRINGAAAWKSSSPKAYLDNFVLTAAVWSASTTMSASSIFGSGSPKIHKSPPTTPPLARSDLDGLTHFINCHGAEADPTFYGEDRGGNFPDSMLASDLRGAIQSGTIAAAECCYGAELFDPDIFSAGQPGICQTYLEEGAYGFFGSSNIAYGPPIGNGAADLVVQYFLRGAITGASLGRAVLDARHLFIGTCPILSPHDLKTLGQFYLLGDPSIHPVSSPTAKTSPLGEAETSTQPRVPANLNRQMRREESFAKSIALGQTTGFATAPLEATPSLDIQATLKQIGERSGMLKPLLSTHDIVGGSGFEEMKRKFPASRRLHIITEVTSNQHAKFKHIRAIVAREVRGQIVSQHEYVARTIWRGRVIRKRVAIGSKSDRSTVVIVTEKDGREYVLRRQGGNAFRDPELDRLVGRSLHCEGEITGNTLILSDYRIVQ